MDNNPFFFFKLKIQVNNPFLKIPNLPIAEKRKFFVRKEHRGGEGGKNKTSYFQVGGINKTKKEKTKGCFLGVESWCGILGEMGGRIE